MTDNKFRKTLRLSITLALSLFLAVVGGYQTSALANTEPGAEEKYAKEVIVSAEAGSPHDQYIVGILYIEGRLGYEQNYSKAEKWLLRSANNKYTRAFYELGKLYKTEGWDGASVREAEKWFARAALAGDTEAFYSVGEAKMNSAIRWYMKAAVVGNMYAQHNMGIFKSYGIGVSKNEEEAIIWHLKAARQGHSLSQYSLGVHYLSEVGLGDRQAFIDAYAWIYVAKQLGLEIAVSTFDNNDWSTHLSQAELVRANVAARTRLREVLRIFCRKDGRNHELCIK